MIKVFLDNNKKYDIVLNANATHLHLELFYWDGAGKRLSLAHRKDLFMLHLLQHVIEHTLEHSISIVPFLFLTYLAMEYIEHKAEDKVQHIIRKAGNFGPVIGAVLGAVPQCGFSTAASNFYAGRVITLGTLMAIYLSTSDEMLPILLSNQVGVAVILKLLGIKVIIGMLAGLLIDAVMRGRHKEHPANVHGEHEHRENSYGHDEHDHRTLAHAHEHSHGHEHNHGHSHGHEHNHEHDHGHEHNHEHNHEHDHGHEHGHNHHHNNTPIHELCEQEHCHCERGVVVSAVIHTVKIFLYILVITFVLNLIIELVGEDTLSGLLLNRPVVGPMIAGVVGLIPNCASSVVITQLFLSGTLGLGSMMAGLLVNAGVGVLVLFRVNRHRKENLTIVALLYMIGVVAGILLDLLPIVI